MYLILKYIWSFIFKLCGIWIYRASKTRPVAWRNIPSTCIFFGRTLCQASVAVALKARPGAWRNLGGAAPEPGHLPCSWSISVSAEHPGACEAWIYWPRPLAGRKKGEIRINFLNWSVAEADKRRPGKRKITFPLLWQSGAGNGQAIQKIEAKEKHRNRHANLKLIKQVYSI